MRYVINLQSLGIKTEANCGEVNVIYEPIIVVSCTQT